VVSIQPCLRTSDIEEVGDNSHLTFFEMLGNFSFNDYFKKEAVDLSLEFLTKDLGLGLKDLEFYIFGGDEETPRDNEAEKILKALNINRIKEGNRKDNFWGPTGEEGPCGPTIDIYFNGIEVWSLVFNEYYKDAKGNYRPVKTKGVDTGMGLERALVALNKKNDVYETDIFTSIIEKIEEISEKKYQENQKAFRIIADHIKASVFLLAEGVKPGKEERNYVLRKLIRRLIRYGNQLGIKQMADLAKSVSEIYQVSYPETKNKQAQIYEDLVEEEVKFRKTLEQGLREFDKVKNKLSGEVAFKLYETYGFPLEMTQELAEEQKIKIDKAEFESAFKKHQEISRAGMEKKFKGGLAGHSEQETKFHTAAHLLLAALREVLGKDINQKGSNITVERIRFDFNWPEKLSEDQIKKVEDWVNDKISQNFEVKMEEMPLSKAIEAGATSIPGFNYPEIVKVFSIGPSTGSGQVMSKEICGGPHVKNTGELGQFKIIKEESSSAGVRRIKAILE